MTYAEVIKLLRRAKGVNQAWVAQRAKKAGFALSATYLSRLENARVTNPTNKIEQAIAAGLEVRLQYTLIGQFVQDVQDDAEAVVSLESHQLFVVQDRVPDEYAARLKHLAEARKEPRTVDGWRQEYAKMREDDAFRSAQRRKSRRVRR